jgi:adenine C2-methylase RlmN of 23S rRNA A2503 and tRNA A37
MPLTQVGCALRCAYSLTGHYDSQKSNGREIVGQILADQRTYVSHADFQYCAHGMGEPLLNYDIKGKLFV